MAKEKGVLLAVVQQPFLAPFYVSAKALAESGKLGRMDGVSAKAAYSNYTFTEDTP